MSFTTKAGLGSANARFGREMQLSHHAPRRWAVQRTAFERIEETITFAPPAENP
jgi:hypothetical protein